VALSADESGILLNAAGAAPSMHNTQPWRFEVAGHVVDVLLDEERTLPAEDPAGRMIRVGLGAAAFNVRVAAAMLGYDADHAIAPDPERPEIVVRVFLGERHDRSHVAELYPEVHRRRTYRGPMLELQIAPAVRTVIGAAARDEGAGLTWLNGGARDRLLGAVLEADLLDAYDDERHAERVRWIGRHRERDGVPEETIGPQPARYPAPHRDLGADAPPRATAEFESRPQVAVLTTTADGPDDWVLAGMALQRAAGGVVVRRVGVVREPAARACRDAAVRPRPGAGRPLPAADRALRLPRDAGRTPGSAPPLAGDRRRPGVSGSAQPRRYARCLVTASISVAAACTNWCDRSDSARATASSSPISATSASSGCRCAMPLPVRRVLSLVFSRASACVIRSSACSSM